MVTGQELKRDLRKDLEKNIQGVQKDFWKDSCVFWKIQYYMKMSYHANVKFPTCS